MSRKEFERGEGISPLKSYSEGLILKALSSCMDTSWLFLLFVLPWTRTTFPETIKLSRLSRMIVLGIWRDR